MTGLMKAIVHQGYLGESVIGARQIEPTEDEQGGDRDGNRVI